MKRAVSILVLLVLIYSTAFATSFSFGGQTNTNETNEEYSEDGVWLDFSTCTDEELEQAIETIKHEQRRRMKTRIVLTETEVSVAKGKTFKNTAEIIDVPEGVKASKITWSSSDTKVATCLNGSIQGVKNGKATITASSKLSDGSIITAECKVKVYTPISSISVKTKKYTLGIGETANCNVVVQPKDAENASLKYESTNSNVASVNSNGLIKGVGPGKATIKASTTDGSKKEVTIEVTVTKKDDVGVKKTDQDGVSVTLLGYKETKGSSYARPESGNIFVLLDVLIENDSNEEVAISSIMSFAGYCDGYTCDYSFSATMNVSKQMDGSIAKGKKMKGQVAYEVPQNWKEIELHVTPDYWGGEDLEFIVYHK